MHVELVRTTTRDGVRLDGAFQAAAAGGAGLGLDGVCLVHGTGGSFYSSVLLEAFAERLPGLGCRPRRPGRGGSRRRPRRRPPGAGRPAPWRRC